MPKALYGVFSDVMMREDKRRWWMRLDDVFGNRVDRAAWNKWSDAIHVVGSPLTLAHLYLHERW